MKYTIIITVYNKEKYIERCLKSVCNQTYKNYSILVVNDGSTDKSEKIIKEYQKKYNIEYYYKENTGIADTRNFAIEKVKTAYFLFVDADDYINLELLEEIEKYDNYDVLSFNALKLDENQKVINEINKKKFKGTGENFLIQLAKEKSEFTVPWGYVYNTEYFKENKFIYPKGKVLEDYYLTPLIIINARKVLSIEYNGYYYLTNENGIVNNSKNLALIKETYLEHYDALNEIIDNSNCGKKVKKIYKQYLSNSLIWFGSNLNGQEQKDYMQIMKDKNIKTSNILKNLLYEIGCFYEIRKVYRNVRDNKIIKNYIYNIIYQLLIVIMPLITIPYKSRVLGPENMGIFSYVTSVYTYLLILGSLGIGAYGRREVAYVKDNKHKSSKILYELILLKLITMLIVIATSTFFINYENKYISYYLIMFLDLMFNVLEITWFYQAIEQFKKISLINMVVKVINTICTFIFIRTPNDLNNYFWLTVISDITLIVLLLSFLKKYVQKIKIKELKIKKHIKTCFILFIPQIFMQLYTVFGKIMLGNVSNNIAEVGFFENSNKIVRMVLNLITSLVWVMIPLISYEFKNGNKEKIKSYMSKSIKFIMFITIPLTFGIIGISHNLVEVLFGEQYLKMIEIIRILALMIVPIGITSIIGEQYLISVKEEKRFTIYMMIGAIINIILNIILIPKYLSIGVAISVVITEIAILFMEKSIVKEFILSKQMLFDVLKYIGSSIIMFGIVLGIGIVGNSIIILLAQVISGMLVYFILLYLMKDDKIKLVLKKGDKI